jgi:hypothetical protein
MSQSLGAGAYTQKTIGASNIANTYFKKTKHDFPLVFFRTVIIDQFLLLYTTRLQKAV